MKLEREFSRSPLINAEEVVVSGSEVPTQMERSRNRNPVYDIMKGIGIILMLIGHIPPGQWLYQFIYSFHMPLFFIVAGFFAGTTKLNWSVIKKYASRLLLPFFVTMVAIIILSPLRYLTDGNFNFTIAQVLSLFWAGDALPTRFGQLSLDAVWFLVALFWAKCFFQGIACFVNGYFARYCDEIVLVLCFVISAGAVFLHKLFPYVPWGLMRGLSAVMFFAIGWYTKRNPIPIYVWIAFVFCWLIALRFGSLDMSTYTYKIFPMEVLGAVGATWLVYLLSKAIQNHTVLTCKLLRWFGINSLLILCVNTLDRKSLMVRVVKGILNVHPSGLYLNTMIHYSIGLALVIILINIPFTNRLFGAKRWRDLGKSISSVK